MSPQYLLYAEFPAPERFKCKAEKIEKENTAFVVRGFCTGGHEGGMLNCNQVYFFCAALRCFVCLGKCCLCAGVSGTQ